MKIALVHDSFTQLGGAERVVDALHELFPEAPVFTLVFDEKFRQKYQSWDIRTSPLQTLYLALPRLRYLLLWIPWAVASLDFSGFDVVISSSSGFVKNIHLPKNTAHICYCHTPPRFLWIDADYVKQEVPFLLRPFVRILLNKMRKWDLIGSKRVTHFIANSAEVQKRIKNIYDRDSVVIHPAIDTEFWRATLAKKDYFLIAGRLQSHKNNQLIIEIFNQLGRPLRVVGTGRQEEYLKSIAKPNIKFLGRVSDEQLRDEYSGALGFIYPQVEDFGLMPLEAAACGTATLAYAQGGALETIIPGQTGELFGQGVVSPFMGSPQTSTVDKSNFAKASSDKSANYTTEIKQIILNWDAKKYKANDLRQQAQKFSREKFKTSILSLVNNENRN